VVDSASGFSLADQTLAFILALTRQVVPYHQEVSSGRWGLVLPLSSMHALARLAVGVIGFGRIGRHHAGQRSSPQHRQWRYGAASLGSATGPADALTFPAQEAKRIADDDQVGEAHGQSA
jgi:D-isomer specific 2-hydroxyacid dehydrogenase, NAD binding domain